MKNKEKGIVKYGSGGAFDLWERIKCFLKDSHYFMSPSEEVRAWCGDCGKLEQNNSKTKK